MRTLPAAISVLAIVALSCGSDPAPSPPPHERSVQIQATGCSPVGNPRRALGTIVAADTVLTAAHPVAGAAEIEVTLPSGQTRPAVLVAMDPDVDLAVLDVRDLPAEPIVRRSLAVDTSGFYRRSPDESIAFIVDRSLTISFQDIYGQAETTRPGYAISAPVLEGDSGGGLIVDDVLGGVIFAASDADADRGWATDIVAADALLASKAASPIDVPCAP